MPLPVPFYDEFSVLAPAQRRALALQWITRALALGANFSRHGALLRTLAQRPDREIAMNETAASILAIVGALDGVEHQLLDRILAMIGAYRRRAYREVADLLLDVADIVDRWYDEDEELNLGAVGAESSVAFSVRLNAKRPPRFHGEIVAQVIGNVHALKR